MNLRELLRNDFKDYIRSVFVKDRCEICGETEKLHLHHIDKFHNLLMETLEELKLQELDTDDYDKMELQSIRNFMLAKQLKCQYKTLCKDCHMKLHGMEQYEDEYKEHYYNPFGGYVLVNIDELKDLKIDSNILLRFLFLSVNINYDGYIIDKNKYKNNKLDITGLQTVLNLSRAEYYNTLKELKNIGLLIINEKGVLVNNKYISKGYVNYKNNSKIFINSFIDLYHKVPVSKHKHYGNLLRLFLHSKYGVIEKSIYEMIKLCNQSNTTRFYQDSIEFIYMIKKINKNSYFINPSIWYDMGLDGSFKTQIDKFNTMI